MLLSKFCHISKAKNNQNNIYLFKTNVAFYYLDTKTRLLDHGTQVISFSSERMIWIGSRCLRERNFHTRSHLDKINRRLKYRQTTSVTHQ